MRPENGDRHPARLVFSRFDGPSKGREPVPILFHRVRYPDVSRCKSLSAQDYPPGGRGSVFGTPDLLATTGVAEYR